MRYLLSLLLFLFPVVSFADSGLSKYDRNAPFGWCVYKSVDTLEPFNLNGGEGGAAILLRNDGSDFYTTFARAIKDYDIVIFDGSEGDFMFSKVVSLNSLSNKTIVGINNATLRTQFHVTDEMKAALDEAGVKNLSSNPADNKGGTLVNGQYVNEEAELVTRATLIELFDDTTEPWRKAGLFHLSNCNNIIIRNLAMYGPGSVDVGGYDLISLVGCNNVWVDHTLLVDGLDGSLDVTGNSDMVTVSWCDFRYTDLSYSHPIPCLTSGTVNENGSNHLNITWAYNHWGEGGLDRQPYAQLGLQHVVCCYYDCPGTCIRVANYARVLAENCYFAAATKRPFAFDSTGEISARRNIYIAINIPDYNADIQVPYDYTLCDALAVPSVVTNVENGAGPTLDQPIVIELSSSPTQIDFDNYYSVVTPEELVYINGLSLRQADEKFTISASPELMLSFDGVDYFPQLEITAAEAQLSQPIYVRCVHDDADSFNAEITVSSDSAGQLLAIPVSGTCIAVDGTPSDVVITWPLNAGTSSLTDAEISAPEAIASAQFSTGSMLYVKGTATVSGASTMTTFNPTEAIPPARNEDCCIVFEVSPTENTVFIPRNISFNVSKLYTDMPRIDLVAVRGGVETELVSGFEPARNSASPSFSACDFNVWQIRPGDDLRIVLYVYNISANKQIALNDFTISGVSYSASASAPSITYNIREKSFYNLMGRLIPAPQKGVPCIAVDEDGSAQTIINR